MGDADGPRRSLRRVQTATNPGPDAAIRTPRKRRSSSPPPAVASGAAGEPGGVEQKDNASAPAKRSRGKPKATRSAGGGDASTAPLPSELMAAAWERANRTRRFIGAHVSASGGVHNSPANAARIGATGFALFLKNQRQWACPALEDAVKDGFKEQIKALGYDFSSVIPHGSYLVNLGNRDKDKREKAYENFLDDLVRCEQLGIPHHNLHPGSTCGEITADESIRLIVDCIDRAHAATSSVIVVLENCAGHANTIGSFEDLGKICAQVKDKSRVGVCLDTCHAFAFGHDIRTKEAYEATMRSFEELVGFKYLRAVHLNDSKGELRCRKDRHENIGKGFIGIEGFRLLLNDPRFADIPLVLETPENAKDPVQGYRDEIDLLYSLIAA